MNFIIQDIKDFFSWLSQKINSQSNQRYDYQYSTRESKDFTGRNTYTNVSGNGNVINGKNIVVRNGKVVVDGVDVTDSLKSFNITVTGNVDKLSVDACNEVKIEGNVNSVYTMSGDVVIKGGVDEGVETISGDVTVGTYIAGKVSTVSGDVKVR